jgi:biofilm PGA synthesis N-glycosyltransferase PgaC
LTFSLCLVVPYVVITPVRNEADHLAKTLESMAGQTVLPALWVIVNDGSTDKTKAIAEAGAAKYSWIRAVHRPDRGFRKSGGGVIEAFYDGYVLAQAVPWDFLAKLDGDLAFEPDYFQKCLAHFQADPKLGIGGGRVYSSVNGTLVDDSPGDPSFHVRGATKIYRRATWEAIGGLLPSPGWDTLDELKANMLGWKTYSLRELEVCQFKPTGSADGTWKNAFKNGRANYVTGYHPAFMMAKCVKRAFASPFLIGAAGLACGYFSGYLDKQVQRVNDDALIHYVRSQQIRKLTLRSSIWD